MPQSVHPKLTISGHSKLLTAQPRERLRYRTAALASGLPHGQFGEQRTLVLHLRQASLDDLVRHSNERHHSGGVLRLAVLDGVVPRVFRDLRSVKPGDLFKSNATHQRDP